MIHPEPAGHFLVGYLVLAVVIFLDVVALLAGLKPLRRGARERQLSLPRFLCTGTDPAVTTVASAMIGFVLFVALALLFHTSRGLLTDLFAIVVGPASLILAGDVILEDDLDVRRLEATIVAAAVTLRARWSSIIYLYLNPVGQQRERRHEATFGRPP